jgi:hypothetical protein
VRRSKRGRRCGELALRARRSEWLYDLFMTSSCIIQSRSNRRVRNDAADFADADESAADCNTRFLQCTT